MGNETKWIQGDGGPAVVLQTTAALQWQSAADFDNSLMSGGNVETDYDVICQCEEGVTVLERYSRDMLVLEDSEWAACFAPSTANDVIIVQWFGSDSELGELVSRLTAAPPSKTLGFTMRDTALRLMVGADDGSGGMYGFSEVKVSPGQKVCEVYRSDEAQVVVLWPADAGIALDEAAAHPA